MLISKKYSIDAAHKLNLPYDSKCNRLHGHTYIITLYVKGAPINNEMVHDYTKFPKDLIMELDHKFIACKDNVKHIVDDNMQLVLKVSIGGSEFYLEPDEVYEIEGRQTTAENIARHLFYKLKSDGFPIHQIAVSETPNTTALYPES